MLIIQGEWFDVYAFNESDWSLEEEKTAYNPEPPLQVTTQEEIEENIKSMIDGMRQEVNNE